MDISHLIIEAQTNKKWHSRPLPHRIDKNYEKFPYFLDHFSEFEKYDPFSCTCSLCEYRNLMMGPNGQNTFLLKNILPLGNTSPKSGGRRILHYFLLLVKYRASKKKVTDRMLLGQRCTGSITSSRHPQSTFEFMGPLNTARAYLCNTSKGLYKLFYPAIPDGRTWSKF